MNEDQQPDIAIDDERARPGESFLQRVHRRKSEARALAESRPQAPADAAAPIDNPAVTEPSDADMPPLETLTSESDYSGFLSSKVSESLRRAALRKLFHSSEFNVLDGLDDYAEDYTSFVALGDVMTAEMRHRLAAEARRQAEAFAAALGDDEAPPVQPVVATDAAPPTQDTSGDGGPEGLPPDPKTT